MESAFWRIAKSESRKVPSILSSVSKPPASAWTMLTIVCLGEFLGMTLWFSATAITPLLAREYQITSEQGAWLTIAVQAGFVGGTLVSALANLADLLNPRTLMF